MEYFSETRKLKTKLTFATGETADIEEEIDTDFVVMLKQKKENINSGYLVILDSKAKSKGEEAQLDSFNIFNEKIVEDFKSNLQASKIPIAEFSFDENGTLIKINLPKNIDLYNAEKIIDLIRNVIPKLTRNKTEDEDNGIEIRTKSKNNKKKLFQNMKLQKNTLIDIQNPHLKEAKFQN